ncbi:hypothetical protein GF420_09760 [candidate division GN15 bacterium]|nr:hypothetical protein [candidate division GN15 bacterium]
MTVRSTSARLRLLAAYKPPKPPPTMTTRCFCGVPGRAFWCASGHVVARSLVIRAGINQPPFVDRPNRCYKRTRCSCPQFQKTTTGRLTAPHRPRILRSATTRTGTADRSTIGRYTMSVRLRLSQIILYCEDLAMQVAFYRDVIGLKVTFPQGIEDYSTETFVTFDSDGFSLALHSGGQRLVSEDAPRLVFVVDDIETARDYLRSEGVLMSEIFSPTPGVQVADGRDPEGNRFSIKMTG